MIPSLLGMIKGLLGAIFQIMDNVRTISNHSRLKEDVAVGFKIFHLTGIDADNDPLSFGVISNPENVVKVVNVGNNEADVVLAKPLDAESRVNYQVVLSLTDGKLAGNFIRYVQCCTFLE